MLIRTAWSLVCPIIVILVFLQWTFTKQDPQLVIKILSKLKILRSNDAKYEPNGTVCLQLQGHESCIHSRVCLFRNPLLHPTDTALLAEMSCTLKKGIECERCDLVIHGDSKCVEVLCIDTKRNNICIEVKTLINPWNQLFISSKRSHNSNVVHISSINLFRALITIVCVVLLFKGVSVGKINTKTASREQKWNLKTSKYLSMNTKEILFDFRHPQNTPLFVYPFSLNQYANDIVRDNKSGEELMKYEWSRYLSFKTFPMDSVMTPMRLAQAGFYSTGNAEEPEEVKCFCCGMINKDWTTDETAIEVHRRISTNCKYLIGDDETNIEIHAKSYYDDIFRTPSSTTNSITQRSESGASGGPTDTNIQPQGDTHDRNSEHKREENGVKNPQTKPSIHTNTNTENSKTGNGIHAGSASSNGVTSEEHARINQAMKYPHYSTLESRVTSYVGWPELDKQDPVELANTGFFHAVHGHEGQDNQPVGPERREQSATEDRRMSNEGNNCNVPTTSTSNNAGPDMDTEATKALLEMGYDREAIFEAIQRHHSTSGEGNVSAKVILEILLNKDASPRESMNNASVTERSGPSTSTSSSQVTERSGPSTSSSQVTERSGPSTSSSQVTERSGPSTSSSLVNKTPAKKSTPKGRKTDKTSGKKKSGEAQALSEENRLLREQMMCKICFDRDADVVFLPCGHMVSCQICAVPLRKCTVCRKLIRGTVKVNQS